MKGHTSTKGGYPPLAAAKVRPPPPAGPQARRKLTLISRRRRAEKSRKIGIFREFWPVDPPPPGRVSGQTPPPLVLDPVLMYVKGSFSSKSLLVECMLLMYHPRWWKISCHTIGPIRDLSTQSESVWLSFNTEMGKSLRVGINPYGAYKVEFWNEVRIWRFSVIILTSLAGTILMCNYFFLQGQDITQDLYILEKVNCTFKR